MIGTVIVPTVSRTPTTIGVAPSATVAKAALAVVIDDESSIPVGNVNVAVAEPPEQAVEVADVPKPDTVAVPVLEQVRVTVNTFVPVAENATFVTEIDPPASVKDNAGASWRFVVDPLT